MAGVVMRLGVGGRVLTSADRPLVMGVVNVTPDSFSDGGRFVAVEAAVAQALRLEAEGAELLDVGGESTRPGAAGIDVEMEKARVVPVVRRLREAGLRVPLSVDTRRAEVARAVLDAGADMVNDVSGLDDPGMAALVAERGVPIVLMHHRGLPVAAGAAPDSPDIVEEVFTWLATRRDAAYAAGVSPGQVVVDPGLGFGKRTGSGVEDNCDLLAGLPRFLALGCPVLVGASRKRFIGSLTGAAVAERLPGSLVAAVAAAWGGAHIVRVHDVAATVQALRVAAAIDPSAWTARGRTTATQPTSLR